MKTYCYNKSPSFGTIKLKPKDLNQSEKLLNNIAEPMLTLKQKNNLAIDLYKIFLPYIKQEAKSKAKTTYVLEEVFSDIKVKFWEFINEINQDNVINDLILKIDKYKPQKILSKFKYAERSLDELLPNSKNKTYSDNITSENLPIPQSETIIENVHNKLNTSIQNTKMTKLSRTRIILRSQGLTYSEIAKEEGVGTATTRKSVKKGILKMQRDNNIVSEENKTRISNLAELLGMTFEETLNPATKHIQILSSSSNVIKRNIENLSKDFKISKEKFVKIASKQPQLLYQKPETISKNIDTSSEFLSISREEFIKLGLTQPALFSQKPETINNKIEVSSKLFGISREEFIKLVLKKPKLFSQTPKTLNKNIETSAELFEIPKASFVKAALKQPALFYQKPKTLNKNIKTSAKLFEISEEEYIAAALKKPQLFSSKPQTIKKNIDNITKILKIPKEEYIKISLKRPQLFNLKPETVNNNISTSAKSLKIKKSDLTKAALKQPQLFYQKPKTINENAETSSKILGISKSDFVKMALKQPSLFYLKPETINKKVKIINYYKTLQKKPISENLSGRSIITSDDELYNNILIHIIKDNCFPKLTKNEIKLKLGDLLNSHQDLITTEIPNFDYAEDFIKYAENYSKKLTGHNVFRFTIKE